jgi:hypothetical protein
MAVSFVFLEFNLFYQGGTRLGSYFGEHLDGVKIEACSTALVYCRSLMASPDAYVTKT